jgi:hypothetical protein
MLSPIPNGHTLVCCCAPLVEPGIAIHLGHHLASTLGWPLFLAVFGRRQLVAENLYATKKLFQRDDQRRPIDDGHKRILRDVEHEMAGRKVLHSLR